MADLDEPLLPAKGLHHQSHVFATSFVPGSGKGVRDLVCWYGGLSIPFAECPIVGEPDPGSGSDQNALRLVRDVSRRIAGRFRWRRTRLAIRLGFAERRQ